MELKEFFKDFEPKSDKNTGHCYIDKYYSDEFSDKKELPIKLLEIGIRQGFSHLLWDKYFTNGEIYGIDNGESGFTWEILNDSRVIIFNNDAYTKNCINLFKNDFFDYIIDDGSHHPKHQKLFIDLYYPLVKVGGKLIIEDIQGKGYFKELEEHCKKLNLKYKLIDLTHVSNKIDDLMIEIEKV
jgi:hypothetical protein